MWLASTLDFQEKVLDCGLRGRCLCPLAAARWMIGVMPQQKLDFITTKLSLPEAFQESLRQNAKGAMLIVEFLKGMAERRQVRLC